MQSVAQSVVKFAVFRPHGLGCYTLACYTSNRATL
jgi:hypothetical protein